VGEVFSIPTFLKKLHLCFGAYLSMTYFVFKFTFVQHKIWVISKWYL